MFRIPTLAALACVAAALQHLPLLAQTSPAPGAIASSPSSVSSDQSSSPTPVSTTGETRVVRVDAIATDKLGRPVINLKPSDFALVENGVAQTIDSAVLMLKRSAGLVGPVDTRAASAAAGSDADGLELEEERAAKDPATRVVALYLDEFHVSAGAASARVREAATRFIDEQLRTADLAVVMKPLDHLTEIRFTRNREALRQVVATFEGRKGDYAARTEFEEKYIGTVPAAVRTARAQIVMSGLRALAGRMGELNTGLTGVVLVTEGFTTDSLRSRERRLPDLQTLVRMASRSRVMLYTVDPTAAADQMATSTPERDPAKPVDPDAVADAAAESILENAARDTGGSFVSKGGDLAAGLTRVSADLDSYYVLTYRSSGTSDGRFRTLQVTTKRRDVKVRARSGYWAPLPEIRVASRPPTSLLNLMRPIRRSLLIQSWFGTTVNPDGTRQVIFTWAPAPSSLTSKVLGRAEVVALKVSTPTGKVLFEGDVLPAQLGATGGPGNTRATFETPPGRLQFDLSIQRADGSKLDVGMEDFDLPDYKKGPPVILQAQIFRAASAREFRELTANSDAAPQPGRDFRRTERVLIRIPTFDAAGAAVDVSAKLMNRTGTVLLQLPKAGDAAAPAAFELPLARFAPGEYALEVAANSESGTSRQLIYFRITG